MTKSLTEQWKDGELPVGTYYILDSDGQAVIDKSVCIGELWDNTDIKEVLAPVPNYQTWKEFQQHFVDKTELEVKLKEAYEQLEQASIKVVELQEQLKEANEVIQLNTFLNRFTLDITTDRFGNECKTFKPSDVYCRKYGLKYGWDYEPKQYCFVKWGVK